MLHNNIVEFYLTSEIFPGYCLGNILIFFSLPPSPLSILPFIQVMISF